MIYIPLIAAMMAVLIQGQGDSKCNSMYYTLNTFSTENSFTFSCHGGEASCNIFYYAPNTRCDAESTYLVGVLPPNRTSVFEARSDFEVGGGFCSDQQIGVYYTIQISSETYIAAHLPRATEAGTKFQTAIFPFPQTASYQCVVAALSQDVQVSVGTGDGEPQQLNLYAFGAHVFELDVTTDSRRVLKIDSDNPVVVSCTASNPLRRLVTLQPISSEPLLILPSGTTIVSVVISDCETNELITNFSRVNVASVEDDGTPCLYQSLEGVDDIQAFTFSQPCSVYIEPVDNACVSVGKQSEKYYLTSVGLPESKFTIQLGRVPNLESARFFSFAEAKCTLFIDETTTPLLFLTWLGGPLSNSVSSGAWNLGLSSISWMQCDEPYLIIKSEIPDRLPFLSTAQLPELWEPFFEADCDVPPTEPPVSTVAPVAAPQPPTSAPTEPPASTVAPVAAPQPPTSAPTEPPVPPVTPVAGPQPPTTAPASDARSLVSCISWASFFALTLISSCLA